MADSQNDYQHEGALRVAEILSALIRHPQGVRLAELVKELDINKTTIYRILITLKTVHFVTYQDETKKFGLGYELLKMSNKGSIIEEIKHVAHPYLQKLSDELNESVILFKRRGDIKYCLDKVDTKNVIRRIIEIGEESPLIYSASGRVMLANMDEEECDQILVRNPLERLTINTITDIDELKRVLHRTKEDGYSVSNGERLEGVFSVAAPVFTPDSKVDYVVGVAIPEYRVNIADYQLLINKVVECGKMLTTALS